MLPESRITRNLSRWQESKVAVARCFFRLVSLEHALVCLPPCLRHDKCMSLHSTNPLCGSWGGRWMDGCTDDAPSGPMTEVAASGTQNSSPRVFVLRCRLQQLPRSTYRAKRSRRGAFVGPVSHAARTTAQNPRATLQPLALRHPALLYHLPSGNPLSVGLEGS